MSAHNVLILLVLLACLVFSAGCQGTKPAPAAPTAAVPPADIPASAPVPPTPAMAAATPSATWSPFVTETPYQGHPASKTYSFEGTGDFFQEFSTDTAGSWVFRMSCPGAKEIFSASVKDGNGDEVALLADAGAGPFSGSKTVQLPAGLHALDVAADAPWTITMSGP